MKIHLNLRMFEGGHDITIVHDDHVTSVTVKNNSGTTISTDVASGTKVNLTVTCPTISGKVYVPKDAIPSITSVEVTQNTSQPQKFSFTMPNADITIFVRGKASGSTLTVVPDNGISAASPLYTEGLANNAPVNVIHTTKSGYEYIGTEVVEGAVKSVEETTNQTKIRAGSTSATVLLKTRPINRYMVTEDTVLCMNDKKVFLKTNTVLEIGKNGKIIGVEPSGGGIILTLADYQPAIDGLIASGVLVNK